MTAPAPPDRSRDPFSPANRWKRRGLCWSASVLALVYLVTMACRLLGRDPFWLELLLSISLCLLLVGLFFAGCAGGFRLLLELPRLIGAWRREKFHFSLKGLVAFSLTICLAMATAASLERAEQEPVASQRILIRAHAGPVLAVDVHFGCLVTIDRREIKIWELDDGRPVGSPIAHGFDLQAGEIIHVSLAYNRKALGAARQPESFLRRDQRPPGVGPARYWWLRDGRPLRTDIARDTYLYHRYYPDRWGPREAVSLVDRESDRVLWRFDRGEKLPPMVLFAGNRDFAVAGETDGTVRIWRIGPDYRLAVACLVLTIALALYLVGPALYRRWRQRPAW